MGTSEQMIAYVFQMGHKTSLMAKVVWESETTHASEDSDYIFKVVRHHIGIDALIKYCIRINSWITPRKEAYPINLTYQNLRHRRMGVTDHGQYDAWLRQIKDFPTYDGTSKSIPQRKTKKNPFHANGMDWDEHGRPVEYDDRYGIFIRRTGYAPPSCYCGASLEWKHQEWPPPTERCRQCV